MSLEPSELEYLTSKLGRHPNPIEIQIVAAEWSEHCSYKSSKKHLKILPTDGSLVITEKGYDSGVLDVGDGYVITAHIESHNHPSAVEPYGGAATGVGGVIRDILSAGTRPIAILDGLRFGDITLDSKARWLFKNVVQGISDYGNCLGIPTIGGEIEFDSSYAGYAMVDVAAIGFGKRDKLIKNHANPGDAVMLLGGFTGRDGIGGSQFASDSLETEDRSAVQIPDPFIEKLLIEAILEIRNSGTIHAMKDLGGGGLSCAISETAEALGIGIEMDVLTVHTRETDMRTEEIMTSESQERMLIITDADAGVKIIEQICAKFEVACSVIGTVTSDNMMRIMSGSGNTVSEMSANVVANAKLLDLPATKPAYMQDIENECNSAALYSSFAHSSTYYTDTLYKLITSPNIASRLWVYNQYDHEVGIRTIVRPGGDASVLRLDNGKHLAVSMDGNPKHCYINPRQGAIGCFEEACRNVICTGATPIGMLDHMQFGNPNDPEIFWTFKESLYGISDFAKVMNIPCIGGKVSLYNETALGAIKPTPVIAVLGLIPAPSNATTTMPKTQLCEGDHIIMVGVTKNEMGGSEYYEYIRNIVGRGRCPRVNYAESKNNSNAVLKIKRARLACIAHDCSKGGAAVAISEMCLGAGVGCKVDLCCMPCQYDKVVAEMTENCNVNYKKTDNNQKDFDNFCRNEISMFSESHSRYILIISDTHMADAEKLLSDSNATYARIGTIGGKDIVFSNSKDDDKIIARLNVDKTCHDWSSTLGDLIHNA